MKGHKIQNAFTLLFFLVVNVIFATQTKPADECENLFTKAATEIQNKKYKTALEDYSKAAIIAQEHQLYEKLYYAKNNIGIIYYTLLDYGEALNYYLEAYTIVMKHLGPKQEMTILNNIAILYSEEEQNEKAENYFIKAYQIAKQEKDSLKIGHYALNLGVLAEKTKNYKQGLTYLQEALNYLNEHENLIKNVQSTLAKIKISTGNYSEAKQLLDKLHQPSKNSPPDAADVEIVNLLGEYHFLQKEYDKALVFYQEAISKTTNLNDKKNLYQQLAKIAFNKKEYTRAFQYKDSIVTVSDSIHKLKNNRLYEASKVKFDLQNYIQEIDSKQQQLSLERKLFVAAVAILFILFFLVYRLFRIRNTKEKQKKMIALREQEIIALELEKKKQEHLLLENQLKEVETNSLLEQEQLKSKIEQKNRQLSAKALYLSGRNEMIEEVIRSLSELPVVSSNHDLKMAIRLLKENLHTDDEWDNFITHFEEVNHGLLGKLKEKHNELNVNDIRFICYVFMNFNTKEICSVFNITQEACRKRKERISKKMGLNEGESLYDYLSKQTNAT